jgi:hypothetical protein
LNLRIEAPKGRNKKDGEKDNFGFLSLTDICKRGIIILKFKNNEKWMLNSDCRFQCVGINFSL